MASLTNETTENGIGRFHLDWVYQLLLHPKRTIQKVTEQEKSVWLTPLLVLSLLVILAGLIAGPIRRDATIAGASTPADFQYYSSDQQAQFKTAQATQSSALFTYVFPTVGALLGIWISWFILSSVLHLSLTLSGSRTSSLHTYNLVAWTMLPLALRQLIQILVMLLSHTVVTNAGLSGFISGSGGAAFLAGILSQIDLFFIWQIVLLLLGVVPLSQLARGKAWGATFFALLILMLIMALPKLVTSMLSGLSGGGGGLF
jgi:Yip1 domain.